MSRAEQRLERLRRRSSRPPLKDPEMQRSLDEADTQRLQAFDELDALTERIDRVTHAINRHPTDGIVVAELGDDDSLVHHVEQVRALEPPLPPIVDD